MARPMASEEKRSTASARAAAPSCRRRSGDWASFAIASASAAGSSTGTSNPVSGRATSRQPGTSVATAARPHAAASSKVRGKPSRRCRLADAEKQISDRTGLRRDEVHAGFAAVLATMGETTSTDVLEKALAQLPSEFRDLVPDEDDEA